MQKGVNLLLKKSALVISSLIAISLLAGCSLTESPTGAQTQETSPNNTETANSSSTAAATSASTESEGVDSFIPIGKKVKIWYLKYDSRNNYQVGLRDQDKRLQWENVQPLHVFLEEDIETSYIERLEDRKDGFGTKYAQFNLHILVDAPNTEGAKKNDDGTGQKSDDTQKDETKKDDKDGILIDLIIGGGSW